MTTTRPPQGVQGPCTAANPALSHSDPCHSRIGKWRRRAATLLAVAVLAPAAVGGASVGMAQEENANPGLADLDEAIAKKIDADSPEDLEQVTSLIESAVAKGLDEENKAFAQKMLGGLSMQQGQQIVAQMMRGGVTQSELQRMRSEALRELEKAIESDPTLVDAHLLIARLSILPGGNPKRAIDAASAAIEQLQGDPQRQSEAYVLRAVLQESQEAQRSDLDAAIAADPKNTEAFQARALLRLRAGETEGAVEDLRTLLEIEPTNTAAAVAAAEALLQLDRADDAMTILDEAIKAQPNAPLYLVRAEVRRGQGKMEEALADVDRAIAIDARNPAALLMRAELKLQKEEEDIEGARQDVDAAMALQPGNARGIYLRSLIAAQQERYADAINDMKLLARNQPDNDIWALQLGNFYQMDQRPRQAIEVATEILKNNPNHWQALRLRGDAYLSIAKHAEAIADYNTALQSPVEPADDAEATEDGATPDDAEGDASEPAAEEADDEPASADDEGTEDEGSDEEGEVEDSEVEDSEVEAEDDSEVAETLAPEAMTPVARSGLLNNLAWVLSTSPHDDLRDGQRAIKLATEAAELTEFKEAHILSTLAAAYAETGDFDKAIEWAKKAVEAGKEEDHDQLEQLENELKSYEEGNPWREEQNVEENALPILGPEDLIET